MAINCRDCAKKDSRIAAMEAEREGAKASHLENRNKLFAAEKRIAALEAERGTSTTMLLQKLSQSLQAKDARIAELEAALKIERHNCQSWADENAKLRRYIRQLEGGGDEDQVRE